ncbi:MAG TPA: hypothetical protein VIK38_02340 [Coriobacteriia bacterium]
MTGTVAAGATPARVAVAVALALVAAFGILFVWLDHATISGDGMAIYVVAESLLQDGDFDLANQHARYGEQVRQIASYALVQLPATGRWASNWPFGMALLWAPFLYVFWWLDALGKFPSPYVLYGIPLPGTFRAIGLALVCAANVWGVTAWGFASSAASAAIQRWEALVVAFAIFFGTPLFFYVTIEPSFSHVGDAVTIAALVWAWLRFRRDSWAHGLLAGIVAGLAILVRWHLFTYVLVLGASSLLFREWRRAGGLAIGVAALTWPICYSWYVMGGSPFRPPILDVVPGFLGAPKVFEMLVSDLRGLLPWSPVAALGLVGLVAGLGRHRRHAAELIACVAAQLVINGMIWDWWAGHSFGSRRLVNLYVVLVVGVAWLIELGGAEARRWGRGAEIGTHGAVLVAAALLSWHTFVLALHYYPSRLDPTTITHSQLARDWREAGHWHYLRGFYRAHQRAFGVLSLRVEAPLAAPSPAPAPAGTAAGRPAVESVDVRTDTIVVYGRGFVPGSVVNLFQQQDTRVVNLGGVSAAGTAVIANRATSPSRVEFAIPEGLRTGGFYVEVVNPPYTSETRSQNLPAAHAGFWRSSSEKRFAPP